MRVTKWWQERSTTRPEEPEAGDHCSKCWNGRPQSLPATSSNEVENMDKATTDKEFASAPVPRADSIEEKPAPRRLRHTVKHDSLQGSVGTTTKLAAVSPESSSRDVDKGKAPQRRLFEPTSSIQALSTEEASVDRRPSHKIASLDVPTDIGHRKNAQDESGTDVSEYLPVSNQASSGQEPRHLDIDNTSRGQTLPSPPHTPHDQIIKEALDRGGPPRLRSPFLEQKPYAPCPSPAPTSHQPRSEGQGVFDPGSATDRDLFLHNHDQIAIMHTRLYQIQSRLARDTAEESSSHSAFERRFQQLELVVEQMQTLCEAIAQHVQTPNPQISQLQEVQTASKQALDNLRSDLNTHTSVMEGSSLETTVEHFTDAVATLQTRLWNINDSLNNHRQQGKSAKEETVEAINTRRRSRHSRKRRIDYWEEQLTQQVCHPFPSPEPKVSIP